MSGFLSKEDRDYVRFLIDEGIIHLIPENHLKEVDPNGGLLLTCADGDIDISTYRKQIVGPRHHEIKVFGGTLNVCDEYAGYSVEAKNTLVSNVFHGFCAKQTNALFLGHHFPCGMATEFNYGIEEVLHLNYLAHLRFITEIRDELNQRLPIGLKLEKDRILDFFHVRRVNRAGCEEQNMYIFDPNRFVEYFAELKVG